MMFAPKEAHELLTLAGLFFLDDHPRTLNMNDVWGWAYADGEEVPEEELPRVAELFWRYGWCGVLYWVSERNESRRSEFHDINRFIDFVVAEENIRKQIPGSSERAYTKRKYSIGVE